MPCLVGKVYHFDNFITHYYITKVTQKPPSHFENILRLRVFCCGRISFGRFFAAPARGQSTAGSAGSRERDGGGALLSIEARSTSTAGAVRERLTGAIATVQSTRNFKTGAGRVDAGWRFLGSLLHSSPLEYSPGARVQAWAERTATAGLPAALPLCGSGAGAGWPLRPLRLSTPCAPCTKRAMHRLPPPLATRHGAVVARACAARN